MPAARATLLLPCFVLCELLLSALLDATSRTHRVRHRRSNSPDPRMNRPSKYPDRLSLDTLLLSASLATRPTLIVSKSASCHSSSSFSKTFAATFARNNASLSPRVRTRLSYLLRVPGRFRRGRAQQRRPPDTHLPCRPDTCTTPASWPAPSRQAIRYVFTAHCGSAGVVEHSDNSCHVAAYSPDPTRLCLLTCPLASA